MRAAEAGFDEFMLSLCLGHICSMTLLTGTQDQ